MNGKVAVDKKAEEYEAIYEHFDRLLTSGESYIDAAPFELVADAFLVGRRQDVAEFLDKPQELSEHFFHCPPPGRAKCGDPIDIGSGNHFEKVTDYATAGQNKLAFTRYYNHQQWGWTNTYTRLLSYYQRHRGRRAAAGRQGYLFLCERRRLERAIQPRPQADPLRHDVDAGRLG